MRKGEPAGSAPEEVVLVWGKDEYKQLEKVTGDGVYTPSLMLRFISGRALVQTLAHPALKRLGVSITEAVRILAAANINKMTGSLLSDSNLRDLVPPHLPDRDHPPAHFGSMLFEIKRRTIEPIPAAHLTANDAALYKAKWESFARINVQKLSKEELEANIIKWAQFCRGSGGRYLNEDFDAAAEEARAIRDARKQQAATGEEEPEGSGPEDNEQAGSSGAGAGAGGDSEYEEAMQQRMINQAAATAASVSGEQASGGGHKGARSGIGRGARRAR